MDPFAHHKAPIKKVETSMGEGRGVQKTDEPKKPAKPSSIFRFGFGFNFLKPKYFGFGFSVGFFHLETD